MKAFGIGFMIYDYDFVGSKVITVRLGFWGAKIFTTNNKGKLLKWDRTLPHPQMEPRKEATLDLFYRRFTVCWGWL